VHLPDQDGPEELDITKVEPSSSDAVQIQEAAQLLVRCVPVPLIST